jgi:hypothetical protein
MTKHREERNWKEEGVQSFDRGHKILRFNRAYENNKLANALNCCCFSECSYLYFEVKSNYHSFQYLPTYLCLDVNFLVNHKIFFSSSGLWHLCHIASTVSTSWRDWPPGKTLFVVFI